MVPPNSTTDRHTKNCAAFLSFESCSKLIKEFAIKWVESKNNEIKKILKKKIQFNVCSRLIVCSSMHTD
jgi:hypothetical protein